MVSRDPINLDRMRNAAESLIDACGLQHPNPSLLECFLKRASDRDMATYYFLQRCHTTSVQQFLTEWKDLLHMFLEPSNVKETLKTQVTIRDSNRCCATGTSGTRCTPLIVLPIIPLSVMRITPDDPKYDLLGAFLTPYNRGQLLDRKVFRSCEGGQNHWLLSQIACEAFQAGELSLKLRRDQDTEGSQDDYNFDYLGIYAESPLGDRLALNKTMRITLGGRRKRDIATPDPLMFQIHKQLAPALRWAKIDILIGAKMQKGVAATREASHGIRHSIAGTLVGSLVGIHPSPRRVEKNKALKDSLHKAWMKVPKILRLGAYKTLALIGKAMYKSSGDPGIQKLPFGLFMKSGRGGNESEFEALKLVQAQTTIPVPRPIDLVRTKKKSYFVSSCIPGHMIGWELDMCTNAEENQIVTDLRDYARQMRAIENPFSKVYAICAPNGKACTDYRLAGGIEKPAGPFVNEASFNESLRKEAAEAARTSEELVLPPTLTHRSDHKIVFTHGDMNMRNVMMQNGRITGIIDWETAGWFPEYWETCKAHYTTQHQKRWLGIVEKAFGKYPMELEVEKEYKLCKYPLKTYTKR